MEQQKGGNLIKKAGFPSILGKQVKPKGKFNSIHFNQKFFDRLHILNNAFMSQFWANNKHLREVRKVSKLKLVNDLRALGFNTTRVTILKGERNRLTFCSLTYLQAISFYWNVSLTDMLYKDFSK